MDCTCLYKTCPVSLHRKVMTHSDGRSSKGRLDRERVSGGLLLSRASMTYDEQTISVQPRPAPAMMAEAGAAQEEGRSRDRLLHVRVQ